MNLSRRKTLSPVPMDRLVKLDRIPLHELSFQVVKAFKNVFLEKEQNLKHPRKNIWKWRIREGPGRFEAKQTCTEAQNGHYE